MDRIGHTEPVANATKIVQAISQIGEFERIQHLLKKDFEGTMLLLEKGVSVETAEDIVVGNSDTPDKTITAIAIIRKNIDILLRKPGRKNTLRDVEQKLLQAMDVKRISETSLLLASQYLHIFCTEYAPRKMKEWEKPEDETSDAYIEEYYGIKYYEPGDQIEKEVTQREKRMLEHCISLVKSYLDNLNVLISHVDITPSLRKQGIADEKNRLAIARNICDTVRKVLERSMNFQPYHDLCYPNNPFNGASDIIIQWEQISKEIGENQQ